MRCVVLVPRRSDGGRRDKVWEWVKARWATEHPNYTVYEGYHTEGPFNRSFGINRAAEAAGEWDVAVIADADTFCGPDQICQAVDNAVTKDCKFWLAYETYCYLNRQMSDRIMGGFVGNWEDGLEFTLTGTCSSAVVVTRGLFDRVGGFDEGFRGWGWEDVGASHAFQTFGGGVDRVPGKVWHLWHKPSTENARTPEWYANQERAERYHKVAYNQPAMDALLHEFGVL